MVEEADPLGDYKGWPIMAECTLEQALRWVARKLPPLEKNAESIENYPAAVLASHPIEQQWFLGHYYPVINENRWLFHFPSDVEETAARDLIRALAQGRVQTSPPATGWDLNNVDWRNSSLDRPSATPHIGPTGVYGIRIPFAELRRAFPADEGERQKATVAAETHCEAWLKSEVAAGQKTKSKNDYKTEATERFSGLSGRAFTRAWANATKNAPEWNLPGRPKASAAKSTR